MLEEAADRFWIWLYQEASRHLPENYHDQVWASFLEQKMDDMRSSGVPDEFILYLADEQMIEPVYGSLGRESREVTREVRDHFRRK